MCEVCREHLAQLLRLFGMLVSLAQDMRDAIHEGDWDGAASTGQEVCSIRDHMTFLRSAYKRHKDCRRTQLSALNAVRAVFADETQSLFSILQDLKFILTPIQIKDSAQKKYVRRIIFD